MGLPLLNIAAVTGDLLQLILAYPTRFEVLLRAGLPSKELADSLAKAGALEQRSAPPKCPFRWPQSSQS